MWRLEGILRGFTCASPPKVLDGLCDGWSVCAFEEMKLTISGDLEDGEIAHTRMARALCRGGEVEMHR